MLEGRQGWDPEVGSRQSVLDALLSGLEEDEEQVEAQKQIDNVTEQIASGDVGGSSEIMQESTGADYNYSRCSQRECAK